MDYWKVPKFIDVQIELTFLESIGSTSGKLYSFGKPVSNGGTGNAKKRSGTRKANTDRVYTDEQIAQVSRETQVLADAARQINEKNAELALLKEENAIRTSTTNKQVADRKVAELRKRNKEQKELFGKA